MTKEDLYCAGKIPVDSERLTSERIVGAIAEEIFFRSAVGMGSRSQ